MKELIKNELKLVDGGSKDSVSNYMWFNGKLVDMNQHIFGS